MTSGMPEDAVAAYLERVADSRVLGRSKRRMRLLEYLVTAEANGEGENLKAYSIGLDVFDKPDDFDPSIDSIVRVEIGRLRSALATFEDSKFADTQLVVDIPVGTYRPELTLRDTSTDAPRRVKRRGGRVVALVALVSWGLVMGVWLYLHGPRDEIPTDNHVKIELRPIEGDADAAARIGAALRGGLVRNQSLTILSPDDPSDTGLAPDFELRGLVRAVDATHYRVDAELINAATNRVVWARSHVFEDGPEFEDRVMAVLGNEVRQRAFGASRVALEGRDPQTLTPEQLFIMATWVPGRAMNSIAWEQERIALARLALEKDPDFGAAHAVLADKLAFLANVYGPADTPEQRAAAEMHARRALELAALDPEVVFAVAQSKWHAGNIAESHLLMQRVLELDPGHDLARFLELVIPYTCRVPPGNVLQQAIEFDDRLAGDNPIRWLTLSWIAWLHAYRGDYEIALNIERRSALIFEFPYTFMRHAMLLQRLGRTEAAVAVIERQDANWPGISADHFARVTVPRLCRESPLAAEFIIAYEELADAMAARQ